MTRTSIYRRRLQGSGNAALILESQQHVLIKSDGVRTGVPAFDLFNSAQQHINGRMKKR